MVIGGLSKCDVEGLVWEYIEPSESEFFYNEIFVGESYMRGGISLKDGDTVVDAGANIGLFSLYCLSRAKNIRLYAIEPIPPLFEVLRRNLRSYLRSNDIKLVQAGLGSVCQDGEEFYYLRHAPGESTRHISERSEQRKLLSTAVKTVSHIDDNLDTRIGPGGGEEAGAPALKAARTTYLDPVRGAVSTDTNSSSCHMDEESERLYVREAVRANDCTAEDCDDIADIFRCRIKTLADVMSQDVDNWRIDLLKLDVEGDELEVLRGIDQWTPIQEQLATDITAMDSGPERQRCEEGVTSGVLPGRGRGLWHRIKQIALEVHDTLDEEGVVDEIHGGVTATTGRTSRLSAITTMLEGAGYIVTVEKQSSRIFEETGYFMCIPSELELYYVYAVKQVK